MPKIMHTNKFKVAVWAVALGLSMPSVAFAEDSLVTYSTPYSANTTEYRLDGDVVVDVNVAAVNALEITLSTSRIFLDLAPGAVNPGYDSDTLNILVGTTNKAGYTLTMLPSYNNEPTTSLSRTEAINDTTPTIKTLSEPVSVSTFSSLSDATTVNKWGVKLDTTNLDVDKTMYNPILTEMQLNSNSVPVSNDPTTISFAAKASNELPAGTYRATLKFIAVANPVIYNIAYDANGGIGAPDSEIIGDGGTISSVKPTPNETLLSRYTHNDTSYYEFKGWGTEQNATEPVYSPGDIYTGDEDATLYAIYDFSDGTLQNTKTACGNNMVDARTGVSYLTAMISGDCYMEQNLYLPMGKTLYDLDSNIYNAVAEKNKKTSWTMPASDLTSSSSMSNTIPLVHIGTYTDDTYNATGTWYNACAVSAGTVCDTNTLEDINSDVCPAGWKLPTSTQFENVKIANRSNWKFYGGFYYPNRILNPNSETVWFASDGFDTNAMKRLRYVEHVAGGFEVSNCSKYGGFFARCVRK